MNKSKRLVAAATLAGTLVGLSALVVMPAQAAQQPAMNHQHMQMSMPMQASKSAAPKADPLKALHAKEVPALSKSIDEAIRLLKAGDTQAALAQLQKAQQAVSRVETVLAAQVKPEFANVRCPIMGSPINPDKVADNLTREFQGKKVAFCCGGCPVQWDKLTDAQKRQKLSKAKPDEKKMETMHMH